MEDRSCILKPTERLRPKSAYVNLCKCSLLIPRLNAVKVAIGVGGAFGDVRTMQADEDCSPPVDNALRRCCGCQRPAIHWTRILDPASGRRFEVVHCRFCDTVTWSPTPKPEQH